MTAGDSLRPCSGMRKLKKDGTTGLPILDVEEDAPLRPEPPVEIRRPLTDPLRTRRELVDDFADDEDTEAFLRASGRNRRIRRGLMPTSRNGRIAAGLGLLGVAAAIAVGCSLALRYATHSAKFRIPSSQAIEIDGVSHLTRAQMLSVFGEDIDHNIFLVPMGDRRTQLEQMPWVEHATVMRLLPNRIRVQVTERTPVAFVRQGGNIGMVDASGVLLDIPPDAPGNPSYSFPVVTGIKAEDDPASREQRMKLYAAMLRDLDSDGKGTSAMLSEVDLSDPEDVKALIPDHNSEVLVHFGTDNFLARYKKFEEHIDEWRTQYPRLSSVDMRYEKQVVLQMPPKDATVASQDDPAKAAVAAAALAAVRPAPITSAGVAPKKPSVPAQPKVFTPPAVASKPATPVRHVAEARPAKVAKSKGDKQAALHQRVEAIKAWMAKREKSRAQAKSAGAQ